jgi:hypothetical protein
MFLDCFRLRLRNDGADGTVLEKSSLSRDEIRFFCPETGKKTAPPPFWAAGLGIFLQENFPQG